MPVARPEPQEPRVIAHVDMDCFYVQVEQRRNPALRGQPTAVVQYNGWKGGGLIAVSYEARGFGVKRSMRGDEAKRVCPGINLVQVPVARGKADLNLYRSAGAEVVAILASKGKCERASIDEVYLDLTDAANEMVLQAPPDSPEGIFMEAAKSNILGLPADASEKEKNVRAWLCQSEADYQDKLLACGAIIVAQLRVRVLEETQFTCSAGIAHNKMLAKLVSGMHKPAQQTVVPSSSVQDLLASLPVKKMKQLGGKLGSSLQDDLGVETIGDLLSFTEEKLQEQYGVNTGTWLWKTARGISGEEVEDRLLPKSHGCGKTFPGPRALKYSASVKGWLDQLCEELSERIQSDLNQNKRIAQTLTLHARAFKKNEHDSMKKFPSKSCPLRYGTGKIQEDAMRLFESGLHEFLESQNTGWGITSLSVTASKIFDIPSGTSSILRYIKGPSSAAALTIPDSPSSAAALAIPDSSFVPEDPSLDNDVFVEPIHEEECQPSTSEKEDDNNTHSASAFSAKKCRANEEKRISKKLPGVQGTSSILKFLSRGQSTLHEKRKSDGLICSHQGLLDCPGSSSEAYKAGAHNVPAEAEDRNNTNSCAEPSGSNTWTFNLQDIDPAVVEELPPEIQREIQGWVRPSKHPITKRRGSTISSYFPPARS
ncbi:DNA polymerase eta isoform X1 [Zea mays]|uniref:DNA polymerase eta n=1 Tax=Zea mays TaxID=4577 RepID=A0A1D6NB50_MAIZE|nr:DNA polymerase eta isoform X1 [Zea mays]ONM37765.1 DNA polymerase eta [Zea mays]|eukprot:XP_008675030.1 DNA polymerase eta isoform X1 [Zea mays]